MLDSIYIGTTGLTGYSKGLNVISNNVANLNTPGFKGANLQFGDMYYQQQLSNGDDAPLQWSQYGTGLKTLGTQIDFKAGQLQQTGNPLDIAITGEGYLVTQSGDTQHLTRAGQLMLNTDGMLVTKTTGRNVQAIATDGKLSNAGINGLKTSPPVATKTVTLQGNLSNTQSSFTVQPVTVIDALGGQHQLSIVFTASTTASGTWSAVVKDDSGAGVGTGTVGFTTSGQPDSNAMQFNVTYSPTGVPAMTFAVVLGPNATSFASGNTSSLAVASQDGITLGTLTAVTIDEQGYLVATYSNGQTRKGQQIALAKPASDDDLEAVGDAEYSIRNGKGLTVGRASTDGFGSFGSGEIEGSNVDLTSAFTNLIVMQRGYQASSKIVSTADEMIQELFDMKAGR